MPNGNGSIQLKVPPEEAMLGIMGLASPQALPDVAAQLTAQGHLPLTPSNTLAPPADTAATTPDQAQAAAQPASALPPVSAPAAPALPPAEMPPASFGAGTAPAPAPRLVGPLAGSAFPATPTGTLPQPMGGPLGGITKPPQTTGQKILGALGKIGGVGLGIVAPGVAMQIPQTPLGKIAQQRREFAQQELQLGYLKTQADIQKAQADAAKARADAIVAMQGRYSAPANLPGYSFNEKTGQFEQKVTNLPPGIMAKDLPPTYRPYPGDVGAVNRRNATRFNALPASLRGNANLADYQVGPNPTEDDVTKTDEGLKNFEQMAIENQKMADAENTRQQQHDIAMQELALRNDIEGARREDQKFKDEEPVIATIPDPANPGNKIRVQTTRAEASKMPGVGAITKPDSAEIPKARIQAQQYSVVQDTLSAYRQDYNAIKENIPDAAIQAMTEIDSIGQKHPGGGGGLLGAITMGTANTLLVDPKERAQVGADWNQLAQYPQLVKLMADYYQTKESAITYIKALDQVGRGVQQAVQQDMQNIPEPWVGGDVANQKFDSMQRVYDRSMKGIVRFPGEIPTPEEIKAQYAQPAAGQAGAAPTARGAAPAAGGRTYPTGAKVGTMNGQHGYVLNGVFHADQ